MLQNLASNTKLSLPLQQQYQALSQQVNGQLYGQPSIPGTAPAYATQVTNGQGLPGYNTAGPARGTIGIGGQTVNNAHAVAGQITGPGVAANAQARPEGMNTAQQPATQAALPGRPVANATAAPGAVPASQLPLSVPTRALHAQVQMTQPATRYGCLTTARPSSHSLRSYSGAPPMDKSAPATWPRSWRRCRWRCVRASTCWRQDMGVPTINNHLDEL